MPNPSATLPTDQKKNKVSKPGHTDPELQVVAAMAAQMPLKITYLDGSYDIVIIKERGIYSFLVQLSARIDLPPDQIGSPFLVYKHAIRSIRPI